MSALHVVSLRLSCLSCIHVPTCVCLVCPRVCLLSLPPLTGCCMHAVVYLVYLCICLVEPCRMCCPLVCLLCPPVSVYVVRLLLPKLSARVSTSSAFVVYYVRVHANLSDCVCLRCQFVRLVCLLVCLRLVLRVFSDFKK